MKSAIHSLFRKLFSCTCSIVSVQGLTCMALPPTLNLVFQCSALPHTQKLNTHWKMPVSVLVIKYTISLLKYHTYFTHPFTFIYTLQSIHDNSRKVLTLNDSLVAGKRKRILINPLGGVSILWIETPLSRSSGSKLGSSCITLPFTVVWVKFLSISTAT